MKLDYRLSVACVSLFAFGCPAGDNGGGEAAGSSDGGTTVSMTDDDDDDDDTTGDDDDDDDTTGDDDDDDTTGDDDDDDDDDDTTGDDDDDDSSSSGGGMGATVSGAVTRSAMPGIGQDAIGDVYLGLLVECDQTAESVASTVIEDADLSMMDASVDYMITDVPDGTYYLAGFMDDNDNADPKDPSADMGDLASVEGFGPGCTEVTVAGADEMDVDIDFNLVVPF